MKLRNKDTNIYLLSVAVCTFVAYVLPAVFLYGGAYYGIGRTICICLLNVSTALLAWKFAKTDSKRSLLMWHGGLNSLGLLLLMGIVLFSIPPLITPFILTLLLFTLLEIFNLFTIGLSLAVYSFVKDKFTNKITKERN